MEPFSPAFQANPYPFYEQIRATDPIYQVTLPHGGRAWWITGYADSEAALKDSRLTKNPQVSLPPDLVEKYGSGLLEFFELITSHMLYTDPPSHTRLRTLIGKAFTPALIEQWRERVQVYADELLDAVQDQGEMELITDFASPIPMMVISEMLGIPTRDQEQFRDWTTMLVGNTADLRTLLPLLPQAQAFVDYLYALIGQRRLQPQTDDLVSKLVQAEAEGEKLSERELISMIFLLIIAGYETTVNLISNGLLSLLQHPEQLALLKSDPSLLKPAIEELLRYNGPGFAATNRWANEDFELGGKLIRRGELVVVVLASANRDEQQFSHANELDITRRENRHLAFGKGIHYCIGAPLARLEGQIALGTLLRRFPNIQLDGDAQALRWRSGVLIHGLEALPVRF
ncbi:cytochrome P450 family protein [Tengunoibacter tsumagoiensis]|nr:cytochrome P450 [Tengunoibacter tsumagoiensis]